MAESTARQKAYCRRSASDDRSSSVFVLAPSHGRKTKADDHICDITRVLLFCCFLQNCKTDGRGFIVKLEGLKIAELLSLHWKKREKDGELQTEYALITSHDTIPGLSLAELKNERWTISCQGIQGGEEQTLCDLICGVISCCGPESLFAGHSDDAKVFLAHRGHVSCDIQLNITILFLNHEFEKKLLQGVQGSNDANVVFLPMTVSVEECLDQKAYTRKYEQIITGGSTPVQLYYCDGIQSVSSKPISIVEQQGTAGQSTTEVSLEQPNTSEHEQALALNISDFEKLKKVKLNSLVETEYHGSPVVYINPDTNESSVIGVHVGDTDQKGRDVVITWHGILKMLQGLVYINIAMYIEFHLRRGGKLPPKEIDYSGTPLNRHPSIADAHDITDNSESPDCPFIHSNT